MARMVLVSELGMIWSSQLQAGECTIDNTIFPQIMLHKVKAVEPCNIIKKKKKKIRGDTRYWQPRKAA